MKAVWNNVTIAEAAAADVQNFDGNHYFPPSALHQEYFKPSKNHTVCPWKGTASYYVVEVDGKSNPDAAWYYPAPKEAAAVIKNYVAFWKGVQVIA
jgi:uncharacterized protein (DUF427 family)